MPYFSEKSENILKTCDRRIVRVCREVIKIYDITIISGFRGDVEQNKLFDEGKSQLKFPSSRHNVYLSKAIDVVPYPSLWESEEELYYLAGLMIGVGHRLGVDLAWGGRWETFFDGAHFELKGI